jgi:hypothetical protein
MPLRPAPVVLHRLLALDNSVVKMQSLTGNGFVPLTRHAKAAAHAA